MSDEQGQSRSSLFMLIVRWIGCFLIIDPIPFALIYLDDNVFETYFYYDYLYDSNSFDGEFVTRILIYFYWPLIIILNALSIL